MHVGCTGHQNLDQPTRRAVAAEMAAALSSLEDDELVGVTSLAEGADQLFAFLMLATGGEVHAVIPSQHYESGFPSSAGRRAYTSLLRLASTQETLPFATPSEDAYLAAGEQVVQQCDLLFAVWDGAQAAGKGGTGDVVAYARSRDVKVQVIWPPGAHRR